MNNQFNGGMLTGERIFEAVKNGEIGITPFDVSCINPNSYNLKLHPQLLVYTRGSSRKFLEPTVPYNSSFNPNKNPHNGVCTTCELPPLDIKKENPTKEIIIPESGYVLYPGILYLGRTVERTASNTFIPMINGRSSGGRLGLSIHICAGFGDIGFDGTWTLEITVVEPLVIYPNIEIAQVCWFSPYGDTNIQYSGKYNRQVDATASRFYKDREKEVQ